MRDKKNGGQKGSYSKIIPRLHKDCACTLVIRSKVVLTLPSILHICKGTKFQ